MIASNPNPYLQIYERLSCKVDSTDPENSFIITQQIGLASQAYNVMVRDLVRLNYYLQQIIQTSTLTKSTSGPSPQLVQPTQRFEAETPVIEQFQKADLDIFKKADQIVNPHKLTKVPVAEERSMKLNVPIPKKTTKRFKKNQRGKSRGSRQSHSIKQDSGFEDDISSNENTNNQNPREYARKCQYNECESAPVPITRYTKLNQRNRQTAADSLFQRDSQALGSKVARMQQQVQQQLQEQDCASRIFQYRFNRKHKPEGAVLQRVECEQCENFYTVTGVDSMCECSSRHQTSAPLSKVNYHNSQTFEF